MDSFVMLHIFVLVLYEYYNNKTLAFCQFHVVITFYVNNEPSMGSLFCRYVDKRSG